MGYTTNNNALTDNQLTRLKDICNMAETEGWSIFNTGRQDATHNPFELQRIDEMNMLKDDEAAIAYVISKATEHPNSFYANAVKLLFEISPNEIDSVFKSIAGSETINNILNN